MHLSYQDIVRIGPKLVEPFQEELVNSSSYDLTLGENAVWRDQDMTLPFDLEPGEFILVTSSQYWRFPCDVSGQLLLKSTMGRNGIDHMLSGWFDPDFFGRATMELKNDGHKAFRLEPGQRVAQMVFPMLLEPTMKPYRLGGRYHGQDDVQRPREEVAVGGESSTINREDPWIAGPFVPIVISYPECDVIHDKCKTWVSDYKELGLNLNYELSTLSELFFKK